ncbi:MAG: acyl-[ACP]--phospholipid O-acyltransferase, partial [Rhodospirillales bacterium]|nr:acyl-[ACP]--phospholipid O-acyltransferase [Rhodospirillales bacterium]
MNDNLFKQALVVLVTFRLAQALDINGQIFVTVAAGVFILPFFLFSATAGQLADKYEKSRSIRIIKAFEIAIMALAVVGYFMEAPYFLMAVLFLMGTQSAFFGPLKYGILPDHLRDDELIGGNALIEGATFMAILIGTIAGGLIILTERGTELVSFGVILFAVLGWGASRSIPEAAAAAPDLKISFNIPSETWRMIGFARQKNTVFMSVLGISWFWV